MSSNNLCEKTIALLLITIVLAASAIADSKAQNTSQNVQAQNHQGLNPAAQQLKHEVKDEVNDQRVSAAEKSKDIGELLRETELKAKPAKNSTQIFLRDVSLASKDVEAARLRFARYLELYLEGVAAEKDVDTARITYEKTQVKLGAMYGQVESVLHLLKSQERLVKDLEKKRIVHVPLTRS